MKAALGSILHVTTLVLLLTWGNAAAEDWAGKLFGETSHDFGTLARGSKAEWSYARDVNVLLVDILQAENDHSAFEPRASVPKSWLRFPEQFACPILGSCVAHFTEEPTS